MFTIGRISAFLINEYCIHLYGCHCNEAAVICLIKEGVASFSSIEEVQVWLVGNETMKCDESNILKGKRLLWSQGCRPQILRHRYTQPLEQWHRKVIASIAYLPLNTDLSLLCPAFSGKQAYATLDLKHWQLEASFQFSISSELGVPSLWHLSSMYKLTGCFPKLKEKSLDISFPKDYFRNFFFFSLFSIPFSTDGNSFFSAIFVPL